jgi:hypothetical protein
MATAENLTGTETGNQAVGKVVILYGTVKVIASDGTERILTLNSPIFAYDRIITESDGRVSILIDDGVQTQIDLGRMSDVIIDDDIFHGASPEEIAEAAAEVEEIQEAIIATEEYDPTVELEAPAAGGEAAAGGGLVVPEFERVEPPSEITSGAETTGPGFDTVDPIPGISEEEPPNDPPTLELVTEDDTVDDSGLPDGTAPGVNLTANGTMIINEGTSDPYELWVNGVFIDPANDGTGGTLVPAVYGNLMVMSNGDWEYTLDDNYPAHLDDDDHNDLAPEVETFNVAVKDDLGAFPDAEDTFYINILDDVSVLTQLFSWMTRQSLAALQVVLEMSILTRPTQTVHLHTLMEQMAKARYCLPAPPCRRRVDLHKR